MKELLIPACLLVLSGGPPGNLDEIAFRAEEGTVLTRTFEARAELELGGMEFWVDGEEIETDAELPEYEIESLERIVVTDEILEAEDGRPTDLLRTFDELLQESTYWIGDNEVETTSASALQGRTVRFYWDDDDEDYVVEANDDEDELEERTLEWLAEDMDLRLALPGGDVEEGDEWEIDPAAYLTLMWPGGLLDFVDEGETEKDADQREMNEEIIENLEGSGSATLEELREEDGVRVAVLSVEFEIETWADADIEVEDLPDIELEITIERSVGGEILWDLDHGHLFSAIFEADTKLVRSESRTVETEDGEIDLETVQTFEGTIEYTTEVERARVD